MSSTILTKLDRVVIRFAGDSGDGMQLTGDRFTSDAAALGNDLSTLPNFPAEIRAPQGTLPGVSSFQVQFADHTIATPGDAPDVLVAMNPAALKANLRDLPAGATIIADADEFTKRNLSKVGYESNPLEDESLTGQGFHLHALPLTSMTVEALADFGLTRKDKQRAKNMLALGLLSWLYSRDTAGTEAFLRAKFTNAPEVLEANLVALRTGHAYGETTEDFAVRYEVAPAPMPAGTYRTITGNQALAMGLVAASHRVDLPLVFGSYPITPASDILHQLSALKAHGVTTLQAEDEIAAVGMALGASFGGRLGVTATSGPGLALKAETIGLAVSTELPLVIIDVQRGGPSTGLPTKTEQSDLMQALHGRNGDCPLAVLSASTPGECFDMAIEAVRIATKYMTPVILLTDGFLANSAEPWKIPDISTIEPFPVQHRRDPVDFHPFVRDPATLARAWAVPGTPGLEHRIGGIEKDYNSGNISYDPDNHHKMTKVRAAKIAGIADDIPLQQIEQGEDTGDLLVVGWGSTYGAISQAVLGALRSGFSVSHLHIRYMNPMPRNLGDLLRGFKKILVPEMNNGMLVKVLRADYLVDAQGLNKIAGHPFKIAEIEAEIRAQLGSPVRGPVGHYNLIAGNDAPLVSEV